MKQYDEANIEKIRHILAPLVEYRRNLSTTFEETFRGFDEKWGYGSIEYVRSYIRHCLESAACWNRLSVDKKLNISGRTKLIERIHEYMAVIKYPVKKREQFLGICLGCMRI